MGAPWQTGTTRSSGADRPGRTRGGTVPPVMGMGGAGGSRSERRRRIVAAVIVLAMVLAVGATLLTIGLG